MDFDRNLVTGQFWDVHVNFANPTEFHNWKQRYKQELIAVGEWQQPSVDHYSFMLRRQATFIHCHVAKPQEAQDNEPKQETNL